MLITIKDGRTFDSDRDLTAEERHVLQKLFIWETMASSLEQFREQVERALERGWNNSGPIQPRERLCAIISDLEGKVVARTGK